MRLGRMELVAVVNRTLPLPLTLAWQARRAVLAGLIVAAEDPVWHVVGKEFLGACQYVLVLFGQDWSISYPSARTLVIIDLMLSTVNSLFPLTPRPLLQGSLIVTSPESTQLALSITTDLVPLVGSSAVRG